MNRFIFPLIAVVIFSTAACKNDKDTYFLIRSDQGGMISRNAALRESAFGPSRSLWECRHDAAGMEVAQGRAGDEAR